MPRLLAAHLHHSHQDRLLGRADRVADQAERVVRGVWHELLRVIRASKDSRRPWHETYQATAQALARLPQAARTVTTDLVATARDSARWTAENLVEHLPARHRAEIVRRRAGLLESPFEAEPTPLATDPFHLGLILPALEEHQVLAVIHSAGWFERIQALTALASPDVLAGQIATSIQQGLSVAQIARLIRPTVQGVQTSARRVARTAGLWVAHEAELATYDQLGDLIAGYQVNAVLDHATRPEHRARDGTRYFRRPAAGQLGFDKMPRPPREADGSWAFNCRCWLEPILGS